MKIDLANTDAVKRRQHVGQQVRDNWAAIKAVRMKRQVLATNSRRPNPLAPKFENSSDTLAERDEQHRRELEQHREELARAEARIIQAKAAARLGGDEQAVLTAQAEYDNLLEAGKDARQEAAQELAILEAERKMLQERLAEAKDAALIEAAEYMRPQVTHWLEALAAFLEANEALQAAELLVEEVAGVTPPAHAAREIHITTPIAKDRLLTLFSRRPEWDAFYGAELAKHRILSARTHILRSDHDARAAQLAKQDARMAKSRAAAEKAAAARAEKAAGKKPRRRPTLGAMLGIGPER